jgi:hypothetical protein
MGDTYATGDKKWYKLKSGKNIYKVKSKTTTHIMVVVDVLPTENVKWDKGEVYTGLAKDKASAKFPVNVIPFVSSAYGNLPRGNYAEIGKYPVVRALLNTTYNLKIKGPGFSYHALKLWKPHYFGNDLNIFATSGIDPIKSKITADPKLVGLGNFNPLSYVQLLKLPPKKTTINFDVWVELQLNKEPEKFHQIFHASLSVNN